MPEFIVHATLGSPYARSVMATLEEKGAKWSLAPLKPGTSKQEPHLSRHPFGRMPVLEHEGFLLYETQAILRYIDRILDMPPLTPADPRTAARMDQVMNINDCYLFQGCGNVITYQRIVAPMLFGRAPDELVIREAMPRGLTVFAELSRLLGSQTWFAGDTISLADLIVAPHLDFFARTPEWNTLTAGSANLVDWLARMECRPSMLATRWAGKASAG